MLSKRIGLENYTRLLLVGHFALALGLPLNKVVLSLATMWILLFTLLEADFKAYWKRLSSHPLGIPFLIFIAFYFLSLLWSDNKQYALHDINSKLPLFVVPLVCMVQRPLESLHTKIILMCFVFTVGILSVLNFTAYNGFWGDFEFDDIRGMSLFISHIRFGLMVSLAAGIGFYFFLLHKKWSRYFFLFVAIWLVYYTYYSQILSGVITLISVMLCLIVFYTIESKQIWLKRSLIAVILSSLVLFGLGMYDFFKPEQSKISLNNLPLYTAEGNPYYHNLNLEYIENGYPVYVYINTFELEREWNKRSSIPFDSLNKKGLPLDATILHYMSSKGLKKDATGVKELTKQDIKHIENGISSVLLLDKGLKTRLISLKKELKNKENINGHSLLQRLEYWKTGWKIALKNPLLGIGIGDVDDAFKKQYEKDKSVLLPQYRLRSHNQFLTFWISTGLVGLLLFAWYLKRAWTISWQSKDLPSLLFLVTFIVSCTIEDTLETQMGVTFFALFVGLVGTFNENMKNSKF